MTKIKTKEDIIKTLKKVVDPELQIDIWTLGLIYEMKVWEGNKIHLKMTFTSPMCPYGPQLLEETKYTLRGAGFENPEIEITFDPPWQPNEDIKMMLGLT